MVFSVNTIWAKLGEFWVLFKDRSVFTKIWEIMEECTKEYTEKLNVSQTHSLIDMPETISMRHESVFVTSGSTIQLEKNGTTADISGLVSIPTLSNWETGEIYTESTDYTINYNTDNTITWIANGGVAPAEYMCAPLLTTKNYVIDRYFVNGLLNIDTALYSSPKWVLYAIYQTLQKKPTVENIRRVINAVAGSPITKYYGIVTDGGGGAAYINYAVYIDSNHEEFLVDNELTNYCFIDTEDNEIYTSNYPAKPLLLAHMTNIERDENNRLKLIVDGEIKATRWHQINVNAGELLNVENCVPVTGYDPDESIMLEYGVDPKIIPATVTTPTVAGELTTIIIHGDTLVSEMGEYIELLIARSKYEITLHDNYELIDTYNIKVVDDGYNIAVGTELIFVSSGGTSAMPLRVIGGSYDYVHEAYSLEFDYDLTTLTIEGGKLYCQEHLVIPTCILDSHELDNTIDIPAIPETLYSGAIVSIKNSLSTINDTHTAYVTGYDLDANSITIATTPAIEANDWIILTSGNRQHVLLVSSVDVGVETIIAPEAQTIPIELAMTAVTSSEGNNIIISGDATEYIAPSDEIAISINGEGIFKITVKDVTLVGAETYISIHKSMYDPDKPAAVYMYRITMSAAEAESLEIGTSIGINNGDVDEDRTIISKTPQDEAMIIRYSGLALMTESPVAVSHLDIAKATIVVDSSLPDDIDIADPIHCIKKMGWKNTLRIDLTWMDIAGKVMANNVRSLMSTIAPTIVPYYAGEERTGLITMPISRNLWEGTGTGKYRERI